MVARFGAAPRRLAARSMDREARHLLSRYDAWTVHSAFERAANLRSAGGELLGLVMAPGPDGPATIVLEVDGDNQALADDLLPGSSVRADDEARSLSADGLLIDLRAATLWSPAPIRRTASAAIVLGRVRLAQELAARYAPTGGLAPLLASFDALVAPAAPTPQPPSTLPWGPSIPTAPEAGEGAGGWGRLLGALGREHREPGSGGDTLVARARDGIAMLLAGWQATDYEQLGNAARMLSGLGPGLTPSGDDLLAGFALGLRAALGALPEQLATAVESAIVGRTTDVAVARVEHAVAGRADAYVDAVLRAVVADEAPNLSASVVTLLGYGHTSGADTLVGLLLGVRLGLDED